MADRLATSFVIAGRSSGLLQIPTPERRVLLDRYTLADVAIKVVGVGSVGTFCGIALLMSGKGDPLFLQFKEARQSVLEPYAGASPFNHVGQRVKEALSLPAA